MDRSLDEVRLWLEDERTRPSLKFQARAMFRAAKGM